MDNQNFDDLWSNCYLSKDRVDSFRARCEEKVSDIGKRTLKLKQSIDQFENERKSLLSEQEKIEAALKELNDEEEDLKRQELESLGLDNLARGNPDCLTKAIDMGSLLDGLSEGEKFVWPLTMIMVNFRIGWGNHIRFMNKLREDLVKRGFGPIQSVYPFWNSYGYSEIAVAEIGPYGLKRALSLQKMFEANHHGKKDWYAKKNGERFGLFTWIAREEDYNSKDMVGEHLRKIGKLKTILEIRESESEKYREIICVIL